MHIKRLLNQSVEMAGEFEPPVKKLKIKDSYSKMFTSFHKDHLLTLQSPLAMIKNHMSGYGVGAIKIKNCNAMCPKSFTKAFCDGEELRRPCFRNETASEPVGYKLSGIFQYGFDVLEAYIASPESTPQTFGARMALSALLNFLAELDVSEKILSRGRRDANKTEWTALVAHHLLSKLAVASNNYTIDDICGGKKGDLICPCGCREKLSENYGDTSMGVPLYWHGKVDILMSVAITIATEETDSSPTEENRSSIEMESSSDRIVACKEQLMAESIVFSFLQKRNCPDLDNFLIPTIAISKSQVAVCMYDCENDIFLETPRLDLFFQDTFLKIETIITLWLVLNYKYFCSGVPDEIMETGFTSDFFKHTGSVLEKYSDDVKAPCDYQSEEGWLALRSLIDVKRKKKNVNDIYQAPQFEKK